jgi:hypothetical protein
MILFSRWLATLVTRAASLAGFISSNDGNLNQHDADAQFLPL